MSELKLFPGPRLELTRWNYDEATGKGQHQKHDVTEQAGERLFQAVTLDPAVTLMDLFGLLLASPALQTVFRRDYAEELCLEVSKGPVAKDAPQAERIEYLELYQRWSVDSETGETHSAGDFSLHGVGAVLEADVTEDGSYVLHKKGERIEWSISLTPVRELLHLPVRVNAEVLVCEDNIDAKAYGASIQTLRNSHITLGALIHEVLWELSWHGTPTESATVSEGLLAQMTELKAGTLETVECDDVFESLGFTPQKTVNAHFFDNSEDFSSSEIYRATRDLADEVLAVQGLAQGPHAALRLRVAFETLTGKGLRKAMRELRNTPMDAPEPGHAPT